ncbi:hypothetical protein MKZ38_007105 [Zalerion maritima]|uniref:DNA replication regulator Sld3 C-terminal domain-containing protein n=1 Tax=Zalerion maritima TaxID=339359 RepID=A0AAD5WPB3_9PEZI|nr:hypothetical protein MKZ38_007105 [Zalerion maritima]
MSSQLHSALDASVSSSLSLSSRTPSAAPTPSSQSCTASCNDSASRKSEKRKMDNGHALEPLRKRSRSQVLESHPLKRSRDSHPMEELLQPTISVVSHPRNVAGRSRTLQPLMLLHRQNVPFAFLDLTCPSGEFPASRFVESHIKPLDLEDRLGSGPVALVAASESSGKVYVLERHQNGIYIVCKLGQWVQLEPLAPISIACHHQALKSLRARRPEHSQPSTTPHDYREQKEKQRAIEKLNAARKASARRQSSVCIDLKSSFTENMGSRAATPLASGAESQLSKPVHLEAQEIKPTVTNEPAEDIIPKPTAEELFQNIRTHHFESLYHSKGSVAYFAKGPLSRARAAFNLDLDCNLNMVDLIDFLRGFIMTTVQIDKKYRERVPSVVSGIKTLVESTDEEGGKPKKKKPKKMKLGKDGFYPNEEEHVRKWWRSVMEMRKSQLLEDETITMQEARFHIDSLRTRETLLQVVIILEILGLEPLRANKAVDSQGLPGEQLREVVLETGPDPTPKRRNKHNLPLMLDVHADRLCIWQSTAIEVPALAGDSQFSSLRAATGDRLGVGASDPLKDFCVDVIVPFFSSRLQQQSDTLCRKFGGPSIIASPPKPNAKPTPAKRVVKSHSRPGAITKRPLLKHPHSASSLEMALSREKARRSISRGPDAIANLRARTLPSVPKLKRENSSGPSALNEIPKASSSLQEQSVNTQGSMKGVTVFEDPRARKKALLDTELKDAISAIKKPNRELAGKSMVEETERRTLSQMKKGRKPTRNFQQQVQVKATPINSRYKDLIGSGGTSMSKLELANMNECNDCIPSSSIIPSSGPRRSQLGDPFSTNRVAATPLKRVSSAPNSVFPSFKEDAIPASSPLVTRTPYPRDKTACNRAALDSSGSKFGIPSTPEKSKFKEQFQTPARKRTSSLAPDMATTPVAATPDILLATPVAVAGSTIRKMFAAPQETKPQVVHKSIFQRLGWDDDDELL